MQHGEIRVCRVNPEDHLDLSDYWLLPMHDNFNGTIPKMTLSYDHKVLLTCGYDGNLFSFSINDQTSHPEPEVPVPTKEKQVGSIFVNFRQRLNSAIFHGLKTISTVAEQHPKRWKILL